MSEYVISNAKIYSEDQVIESGYVHIKDGKIEAVKSGVYTGPLTQHDAEGKILLPGFIDIHIHGGYGNDAMDASVEGLQHLAENLLSEGTTSFLATTMTQSEENINKALESIVAYKATQNSYNAAEIVGIHLEGPFISEHKVGAQNPAYVQQPSVEKLKHFQETADHNIKILTFAPEVEGADVMLEAFKDEIIFSIGHTTADFDQVNAAVAKGAKHITHLYNAGTPFLHRAPGDFGAAWTNDDLSTELIVDGVHSHPASIKIAYKMKGNEHFYVITDAMRAKGMSEGEYDLGGQTVVVKGKEARLKTGSLAGSILRMNQGLKNLLDFTGDTLENAWRTTSLNQAKALKIDNQKGSIKPGKDADLILVDEDINVLTAIKKGKIHSFS
ncbi:N-acetylglucosamine-6-phosphate deacetylase [Staphylococcus simulans]|uniref:N-acetylglucosamine-6-phosphate deacetylase n=1 Tax=Staphylococcus simulans TaxID=1286 RepID=UPI000D1E303C|nr:N-acetylglucosamine-6-phosphate deacetylase [Staphylococcus simulans]PTJ92228.1 N-acetylglucosamine-6-phosphate deacetylase [Staphylococcus simulans]UXR32957.1 N-acetylglucosamine-6-phosphate deacetylase [Staphylococcus simulans]